MKFIQQYLKGADNFGTYILTGIFVFLGLLIGNMVVLGLAYATAPNLSLTDSANPFAEFETNTQLVLIMLPFLFALIALMLSIKFVHKRPILTLFTARGSFDWKRYFLAFGVWLSVLLILLTIMVYTTDAVYWNLNGSTFFMLLAISCVMFPIQTAAEEAFFRGWLFQGIGKRLKHAGLSILFTGIIFGLMHGANPEIEKIGYGIFAYYIISGVFLGIIAHLDDGLELGMGYHAANNMFAAVILTNDWQVFHTDAMFIDTAPPSFGWDAILTIAIIQPLFLIIFGKIYKWKNWRTQLFRSTVQENDHSN
ncbi:MAG: CPBP family intramembrane metalloprotease [Crocinitomicaceae bacterium]|nr:CPBP family glutamic-type intramembrane protease [Flavobacteriales bacterium]NQZ36492.1 CPBP family intramembrane metalloprotease [Crocinitomicaceae bacterium]